MKRIQNTARNIFVIEDTATFGTREDATEQYPTAPISGVPEEKIAHPLRGILNSALSFIASSNEVPSIDEPTDEMVEGDHLIPLLDEETSERDGLSSATAFLNSIADSLSNDDECKAPRLLSIFKSRFLR